MDHHKCLSICLLGPRTQMPMGFVCGIWVSNPALGGLFYHTEYFLCYVRFNVSGQKIIQDTFPLVYEPFCLQVLIIYKRRFEWNLWKNGKCFARSCRARLFQVPNIICHREQAHIMYVYSRIKSKTNALKLDNIKIMKISSFPKFSKYIWCLYCGSVF